MQLPNKFPTFVGILMIIGIVGSIGFAERMFRAPSGASGSKEPRNVRVTNITGSSFTVSWISDAPTAGTLLVSAPNMSNRIYYDERDQTGKINKYDTHSITVRDAHPATIYSYKLMSDGTQYLDNGKPYIIQTPSSLPTNTSTLEPAYGTIYKNDGQPGGDILVYLTLDGGQELSTLTKPSGVWLIALNQVRTLDLSSFLPTLERMDESIIARDHEHETVTSTDTLNDAPVPDMTIGKNYDFRKQQAKTISNSALALRTTPTAPPQAPSNTLPVGWAVLGDSSTRSYTVSLTSPVQGATLTTTLPLVQGTGIPNKYIGISLGLSTPITGSVKVEANGLWSFTPPKPLPPGKQSVTISTVDATQKSVAITHTFEIFKSGTQVLGVATPSGTLTTTPATTVTIAPESVIPTSTLSAQPPPTSGYELPTILLLLLGVGLFVGGAAATVVR